MKHLATKSNKTSLIWLVALMLVFHSSMGNSGSGSLAPLWNLKQTELTLTTVDLKSAKKSHPLFNGIGKNATRYTFDISFYPRISHYTQSAEMKWKMFRKQYLSTSQITVVHVKLAQNDDDDLSILKG
jgi:hypothetical protein